MKPLRDYAFAVVVPAVITAVGFGMFRYFELINLVMVYLVGTVIVASRGRQGPALVASLISIASFDFFFVPPRFTFSVSDAHYLWTFIVMLAVAMMISQLTIRLHDKATEAEEAAARNVYLFEKAKKAEVDMESERVRSSLLSAVSHDLRTPLAAIVGSASALLEKPEFQSHTNARELLENIQTEGERLARLVQNLLEVTRLETGVVQIHKERYPLEEVIGSALERLEKTLGARSIHVTLPPEMAPVPLDGVLMEQVFINLIENALRHTPPDRTIQILAECQTEHVQVTVVDQGEGIPEGDRVRVFEKFYRSKTSSGAGLGLAICQAIIQAHGGRIWVENAPAGGAAFRFTLPL